jgi:rhodanese-related sulfurtransferase
MKKILYMLLGMIGCSCVLGQPNPARPHCRDPLFDKMVSTLLKKSIPLIDADSLLKHQDEYILFDVREREEFEVSHIPGARHLGYKSPSWELLEELKKDQPIALYCSVGYRSEKIGELLRNKGFENVYNVYGSVFEWANRGYTLTDLRGHSTAEIHGYSATWGLWINNRVLTVRYK